MCNISFLREYAISAGPGISRFSGDVFDTHHKYSTGKWQREAAEQTGEQDHLM